MKVSVTATHRERGNVLLTGRRAHVCMCAQSRQARWLAVFREEGPRPPRGGQQEGQKHCGAQLHACHKFETANADRDVCTAAATPPPLPPSPHSTQPTHPRATGFRFSRTILFEGHQRCNAARVPKGPEVWALGGGGGLQSTVPGGCIPFCQDVVESEVHCVNSRALGFNLKGPPVREERFKSAAIKRCSFKSVPAFSCREKWSKVK